MVALDINMPDSCTTCIFENLQCCQLLKQSTKFTLEGKLPDCPLIEVQKLRCSRILPKDLPLIESARYCIGDIAEKMALAMQESKAITYTQEPVSDDRTKITATAHVVF